MSVFAVTNHRGPRWDPDRQRREQAGWDDHAEFMDAMVDEGVVILGGPIGDGENTMLAMEAENEQAIHDRFANDPWFINGILRPGKIELWTIWLDGTGRH